MLASPRPSIWTIRAHSPQRGAIEIGAQAQILDRKPGVVCRRSHPVRADRARRIRTAWAAPVALARGALTVTEVAYPPAVDRRRARWTLRRVPTCVRKAVHSHVEPSIQRATTRRRVTCWPSRGTSSSYSSSSPAALSTSLNAGWTGCDAVGLQHRAAPEPRNDPAVRIGAFAPATAESSDAGTVDARRYRGGAFGSDVARPAPRSRSMRCIGCSSGLSICARFAHARLAISSRMNSTSSERRPSSRCPVVGGRKNRLVSGLAIGSCRRETPIGHLPHRPVRPWQRRIADRSQQALARRSCRSRPASRSRVSDPTGSVSGTTNQSLP